MTSLALGAVGPDEEGGPYKSVIRTTFFSFATIEYDELLEPDVISTMFGEMVPLTAEDIELHERHPKTGHLVKDKYAGNYWRRTDSGRLRPVLTYWHAFLYSIPSSLMAFITAMIIGICMDAIENTTLDGKAYHTWCMLLCWIFAQPMYIIHARLGEGDRHARLDRWMFAYIFVIFHVFVYSNIIANQASKYEYYHQIINLLDTTPFRGTPLSTGDTSSATHQGMSWGQAAQSAQQSAGAIWFGAFNEIDNIPAYYAWLQAIVGPSLWVRGDGNYGKPNYGIMNGPQSGASQAGGWIIDGTVRLRQVVGEEISTHYTGESWQEQLCNEEDFAAESYSSSYASGAASGSPTRRVHQKRCPPELYMRWQSGEGDVGTSWNNKFRNEGMLTDQLPIPYSNGRFSAVANKKNDGEEDSGEQCDVRFDGKYNSYGCGGFVKSWDMHNTTYNTFIRDTVELQQKNYINRGTRAVILEFAVLGLDGPLFGSVFGLNPHAQVSGVAVAIGCEFHTSGALNPMFVKAQPFITPSMDLDDGNLWASPPMVYMYFMNWWVICVIGWALRSRWFSKMSNAHSQNEEGKLLRLAAALFITIAFIQFCVAYGNTDRHFLEIKGVYSRHAIDMNWIQYASSAQRVGYFQSFTAMVIWARVLWLLTWHFGTSMVFFTLSRGMRNFISFTMPLVFFIMAFAFVFMMCMTNLQGFASFFDSFRAIFAGIQGEWSGADVWARDQIIGTCLYLVFTVCGVWILFNFTIAVIVEAYDEAKEDHEARGIEKTDWDRFWGYPGMKQAKQGAKYVRDKSVDLCGKKDKASGLDDEQYVQDGIPMTGVTVGVNAGHEDGDASTSGSELKQDPQPREADADGENQGSI